eukprot:11929335-Ditylum_brightwellii.AAC.1
MAHVPRRYRPPCRKTAMRPPRPTSPHSASRCIETPQRRGSIHRVPPLRVYEYTFYATLPMR